MYACSNAARQESSKQVPSSEPRKIEFFIKSFFCSQFRLELGRTARTIRIFSLEVSPDLVLLDVRNFTFQHFTVDWNFNVPEMAIKTLHLVQGLSRTPFSWSSASAFSSRFTNKCPGAKPPRQRKYRVSQTTIILTSKSQFSNI